MLQTLTASLGDQARDLLEPTAAAAGPAVIEEGWVQVAPGQLRPARRSSDGRMYYSPDPRSRWAQAPAVIAATWITWYRPAEGWCPFTAPAGMRVVHDPRQALRASAAGPQGGLQ